MSLRNYLLGYRWSLGIYYGENNLRYKLVCDSVVQLAGTVMHRYKNGGRPRDQWFLWMKFTRKNTGFLLQPSHFASDGTNLTAEFSATVSAIDPGFRVQAEPPVCVDATGRRIPLYSSYVSNMLRGQSKMDDFYNRGKEETFSDILTSIFH